MQITTLSGLKTKPAEKYRIMFTTIVKLEYKILFNKKYIKLS